MKEIHPTCGIWLKVQIVYLEGPSKTAWVPFSLLSNEALFFQFTKCGKPDCQLCKPPRLPGLKFDKLLHTPDTILGTDGHYLSFCEVFGKSTDEKHRLSLQKSTTRKSLQFVASVQHAVNTGYFVQCEECEVWHLVYTAHKLSSVDKNKLSWCLQEYTLTCGTNYQKTYMMFVYEI